MTLLLCFNSKLLGQRNEVDAAYTKRKPLYGGSSETRSILDILAARSMPVLAGVPRWSLFDLLAKIGKSGSSRLLERFQTKPQTSQF